MSDEEIAKEFVKKECCPTCDYKAGCDSVGGCYGFDCFLAGLKAGKPQWHDLRKDPNDLPKEFDINKNRWEMEKRITKHIVQNECGERVFCLNGTWYHEKGGEAHPIAWCEIPTFEKENTECLEKSGE